MKTSDKMHSNRTLYYGKVIFPFLCFAILLMLPATTNAQPLSVGQLQTEYRINPLGINTESPRFSWIIQGDERDTRQTARQLQVARGVPDFDSPDHLIHDTGMAETGESVHKVYSGPGLQPGTRYYWRVRVRDNHGYTSAWSEPAWWETGLMDAGHWQADWIKPDLIEDVTDSPPAPMLRREFRLDGEITQARAYATAHGVYEMEINGRRVGDQVLSPGWTSYHNRLQYQTYDITRLLRNGDNAVGVMLGDGWFRGYMGFQDQRNYYGETLALLLQIEVTYADGRSDIITTDEHWKANTGPIIRSDIYNGEVYDARRERDGWTLPGFDDGNWAEVTVAGYGKEHLIGQQVQPVRKIQELRPREIFVTPEGDTVADFGQNMIGWIRLMVEGEAGTQITLRHAEVLDRDGNFYTDNLRAADQENTYILKGEDTEVWEPRFTFQGFRYVAVHGYSGELTPDALTGVVLHSDMPPTGHFQSSDPLVNRLQHNIVWGQKGNFLDIPTDCPQRDERLGWTGDIQVFAETANLNMNTNAFLTKWLADLEADQTEEGSIPHVVPNVLPEGWDGAAGWADAGVIVPWSLYKAFGDTRILEKQYESMKAWVDYVDRRAHSTANRYLWDGDYTFGDWLSFNTTDSDYPGAYTDRDLIATAFFARSSWLLAETAGVLGRQSDHIYYMDLYENIREAFQREFVTPAGRLMSDTQTSYLLALRFGLLPDNRVPDAVDHLIRRIRFRGHLTTGFLGTPHLNPILSEYDRYDLAYELLMRRDYPSWLYPVTMDATTIWERWDGIRPDGTFQNPGMNSFNHYAYGAIGEWLFRETAGLQLAGPGYRDIRIAPVPGGGLDHARAFLDSPYGRILSSWDIDGDTFLLEVKVPVNTTASIHLPHARADEVTESGQTLTEADGITEVVSGDDGVNLRAGSGHYRFVWPWPNTDSGSANTGSGDETGSETAHGIGQESRTVNDAEPGPGSLLAELLANRQTRSILEQHHPELMRSPWLSQVMGFPLETATSTLPERYRLSQDELNALIRVLSDR